ncbi:MAG: hypothetical protein KJ052_10805, partial [Candidatus Hydrogenedentes bacterium]|nr:hypothetical protein [Candidatus Hydrogenedentota bacterium]
WPLGRWKGLEPDAAEARRDRYSAPWLIVEKVPFFILSLAGGVVAILAARQGGSLKDAEAYPLGVRLANALISYSTYLWKTIVPTEIAAFYPHPGRQVANGLAMASALFLLSVTVIVLLNARRRPWLITGWFWYLVSLAPVSGLLQIGA